MDEGRFVGFGSKVIFLDEFRMMVSTAQSTRTISQFTVFDTLISQGSPTNLRRFCVPLKYSGWKPSMHVDRDMPLGTPNQDDPLIVDPAQAFVVLGLFSGVTSTSVYIVSRIQALINHTCSPSTEIYVRWGEWGGACRGDAET